MRIPLVLLFSVVALLSNQSATAKESDFALRVETLEALEDGPLVLRVILYYQGNKRIRISDFPAGLSPVGVTAPQSWRRVKRDRFVSFTGRPGTTDLEPKEKLSKLVYVHLDYKRIPAGKAPLTVTWCVHGPGGEKKDKEPVIARPSITITVNVLAATPERVRALRQRLEAKISQAHGSKEEREKRAREVENCLENTHLAGLAPVAWRLIESPNVYGVNIPLEMVYTFAEDKGAASRRLVKLACSPDFPHLDDVFGFWDRDRRIEDALQQQPDLPTSRTY